MNPLEKVGLLAHIVRWRASWDRYDLDACPAGLGPKFISARRAAELIPDGATVFSCGQAGHHRGSIYFWALRDRYRQTHHPKNLTWCCVGAQGGRGKVPGTLEEVGQPGLVTKAIIGHLETVKSFLKLGRAQLMELHTLPQGEYVFLLEGQAAGTFSRDSDVGVGTFLDPRVGPGSAVTKHARSQYIEVHGDRLRYSLPKLEFALFSIPYADRDGNLYATDAACLSEIRRSAQAVKANGGTVIATVAGIVPGDAARVYVPTELVDYIIVNPRNEQMMSIPQLRAWKAVSPGAGANAHRVLEQATFINDFMKITPHRTPADMALARLAATVMVSELYPGAVMNIGVGLAEEASKLMYEAGINDDLHQSTESGAYGGVPMSGVFFGTAVNPERHEDSAWVFHQYEQQLDLACLGMLEVDSDGNVNVSRRGEEVTDYVGPGGLTNIAHYAKTIIFVGAFANHSKLGLRNGELVVEEAGEVKFVDRVREITFNGKRALAQGKRIWYVTHLGVFRLTGRGLELQQVMPGVDPVRDILNRSGARIVLPTGGMSAVSVVPPATVTGQGFSLSWPEGVKA